MVQDELVSTHVRVCVCVWLHAGPESATAADELPLPLEHMPFRGASVPLCLVQHDQGAAAAAPHHDLARGAGVGDLANHANPAPRCHPIAL